MMRTAKIVCFILLLFFSIENKAQSDIGIGYLSTTLKQKGLRFASDYAKKLEPKLDMFRDGSRSLFAFTPDIKVLLGSDDAFNGILLKYTGNIMLFDTTTVSGISGIPDLGKTFSNFPISAGFETDQDISFGNALLEAGYVPWYQNNKKLNKYLRQTKAGIFLQGGYKFAISSKKDSVPPEAGNTDESAEETDNALCRAKITIGFGPRFIFHKKSGLGIALIGNGDGWYDFLNSEVYYHLEGAFRFYLTDDYYLDLKYEKGSGAPNFNPGEQFSANIGITF